MTTALLTLPLPFSPSASRKRLWGGVRLGLWHGLGLVLMLAIASYATWLRDATLWDRPQDCFFMAGLTVLAYIGAAAVACRLTRFARVDGIRLAALSVTVAFVCVVVVVAFVRTYYYSGFFLLASYLVAAAWQILGYLLTGTPMPTLALLPGGMARKLRRLPGATWVLPGEPDWDRKLDGVVVDFHATPSPKWMEFVAECSLRGLPMYHAATIREALTGRVSLQHLSVGTSRTLGLPPFYPALKRILDLALVIGTLPLMLPLAAATALVIRLSSPGPIFFRQERTGQGGKPFHMVKFRSMRADSEANGAQFAQRADDRITAIGRLIRKTRLDELPQFWNVLKGNMSLIGPRPEQVPFAREFEKRIPFYAYRHTAKPGISGWAQIACGYAAGAEATQTKLAYDLYYVKHMSFWLDLLILFRTFYTVVSGYGAR